MMNLKPRSIRNWLKETVPNRKALRILAPAKINLDLQILGRKPNNYHELSSLIGFLSLYDVLEITPSPQFTLDVVGNFAKLCGPVEENLAYRAAHILAEVSGQIPDGHLLLRKYIPVGAGLGGGSADAAAVLVGLSRFWGLHFKRDLLMKLAQKLGADVPMMVQILMTRPEDLPILALISGIGETIKLRPLPLSSHKIVLIYPYQTLNTGKVYRRYDELQDKAQIELESRNKPPVPRPKKASEIKDEEALHWSLSSSLNPHNSAEWLAKLQENGNDLTVAAQSLEPSIEAILKLCQNYPKTRLARMSGSGSACFALVDNEDHGEGLVRQAQAEGYYAITVSWHNPNFQARESQSI